MCEPASQQVKRASHVSHASHASHASQMCKPCEPLKNTDTIAFAVFLFASLLSRSEKYEVQFKTMGVMS